LSTSDFSYTVKLQKRRTLVIYVLADGGVEVRAPLRTAQQRIVRFVEERAAWVQRTRERQLHRQRWQAPIEAGADSWLLGEILKLEIAHGNAAVNRFGEKLLVTLREPANVPMLTRVLNDWYRDEAEKVFKERLPLMCQRFPDLAVPELRLRRMRRRWGSCNRGGRVTLNIELVKLPLELVDYVIVHELCHLFHFNHGVRFYRLLGKIMPDWKEHEALLKQF
jgi:predicted metal-dependent hydrolase